MRLQLLGGHGYIFYRLLPKTVKAQLSPYLPFKERLEELEVGEGG